MALIGHKSQGQEYPERHSVIGQKRGITSTLFKDRIRRTPKQSQAPLEGAKT